MESKREYEEAEQRFQESLRLRASGDLPVAERLLRSLANEDPENFSVLIVLAGVLIELEKFTEAAGVFTFTYEKVSRLTASNQYLEPTTSTTLRAHIF